LQHEVSEQHARFAIAGITGVPFIDGTVANILRQANLALQLLGSQFILIGIRPELSQGFVSLGSDFSNLVTCASLSDGISYSNQ
jgi:rsbT co-antagonist protein RsbR